MTVTHVDTYLLHLGNILSGYYSYGNADECIQMYIHVQQSTCGFISLSKAF